MAAVLDQWIVRVLEKLDVDPAGRMCPGDQDAQYTACEVEELPQYVDLYARSDVTDEDKRVLGCFILQGLEESLNAGHPHPLQDRALELLFGDETIHAEEFEYWSASHECEPFDIAPALKARLGHTQPVNNDTARIERGA